MKMKNFARRKFLKAILYGGLTPILGKDALSSLLETIILQAYGAESENENNYVGILLNGGPPRWMFDLPLRPNDSDSFVQNPMAVTKIVNDNLVYSTVKVGSYNMPPIWNSLVPQFSSGDSRLSALLNNTIMFRGYSTGSDGHVGNRTRHFQPALGGLSIDGALAAKSGNPIPSIYIGENFGYNSPTGGSTLSVSRNDKNPLNSIISNFVVGSSRTPASLTGDSSEEAFDLILKAFEKKAHENNLVLQATYQNRLKAKAIFKREFSNLQDAYTNRYNQFRNLEIETLTNAKYNLGDGIQKHDFFIMNSDYNGLTAGHYDLNDINQVSQHVANIGANYEAAFGRGSALNINNLAHSLTITEYLLSQKLISTSVISLFSLQNLIINSKNNYSLNNDAHFTGAIPTLFFFSKYYQTLGACLLEFTKGLKKANIFDKTLIQLSGDFNRTPRKNCSGSDHGWYGSNSTIISGMIQKHEILGNITANDTNNTVPGTWGRASEMSFLGNSAMGIGHVISSVATMLDCQSPSANFPSLVKKNSSTGIVTSISGVGTKNV